jgi:hypothetical protein
LPYAFFGSFVDKRMYLQAQNIEIGAMLSSKFLITSQGIGESIETPIIERIKGEEESSPTLAIGFVGGRVHPDDMRHIEVQLARHLQHDHPLDATSQSSQTIREKTLIKLSYDFWTEIKMAKSVRWRSALLG